MVLFGSLINYQTMENEIFYFLKEHPVLTYGALVVFSIKIFWNIFYGALRFFYLKLSLFYEVKRKIKKINTSNNKFLKQKKECLLVFKNINRTNISKLTYIGSTGTPTYTKEKYLSPITEIKKFTKNKQQTEEIEYTISYIIKIEQNIYDLMNNFLIQTSFNNFINYEKILAILNQNVLILESQISYLEEHSVIIKISPSSIFFN